MKVAELRSRCECQAVLRCKISADGRVLSGTAVSRGETEVAPATRVGTLSGAKAQVDVGFLCPFCGRNTLRTFDLSALAYRDAS